MAFNLSGVDLDLYFDVNLGINLSIFGILVFPPLLLCLLCVLGLVLTKDIDIKIRVLLVNIFVAEIGNWVAYIVFYIGFPIRLALDDDFSCKLFLSCWVVSAIQKFSANALYAINIYIFIKHGVKKLKWKAIVPYIVTTWIVAFLVGGIIPYLEEFGAVNINGFCTNDRETVLFFVVLFPMVTLTILFLIVELVCSILTAIYIKKNTIRGNKKVKKAVVKYMLYLVVTSILSFINSILPTANPAIREALPEDDIIGIVAVNYVLRLIFNIPTYATPIVAIALLKPVRTALKKICCKNRVEPAIVDPAAVEPAAAKPVAAEPAVELAVVQPAAVKPATVERATLEPAAVEPAAVEPAAMDLVAVEPATVEPAAVEPAAVEPVTMELKTVEPEAMETVPATVEPAAVEPTAVEPATMEPATMEPAAVKPTAVEPATMELATVQSATVDP